MAVDPAGQATAGTTLPETHRKPWGAGRLDGPLKQLGLVSADPQEISRWQVRMSQHNPYLCTLLIRTGRLYRAFLNTVLSLTAPLA